MSVGLPVVVVEDHDGCDDTAGHHEHDAVEVRPCNSETQITIYIWTPTQNVHGW